MPEAASVWEVRLAIHATEEQADEIKEAVKRVVCPDPDHAPPCPIPWAVSLQRPEDGDAAYPELVEQAHIEQRRRE